MGHFHSYMLNNQTAIPIDRVVSCSYMFPFFFRENLQDTSRNCFCTNLCLLQITLKLKPIHWILSYAGDDSCSQQFWSEDTCTPNLPNKMGAHSQPLYGDVYDLMWLEWDMEPTISLLLFVLNCGLEPRPPEVAIPWEGNSWCCRLYCKL